MSLQIGIVGLPNVGKSTLFKALTKKQVEAANYAFTTIEPNVGVVAVPDERLPKLVKVSNSAKVVPTIVEFVDIAGLVKGAAEGEGLGNKFLSHIREVDAIAQVVRIFDDPDVTHVHGSIDPANDIEVISAELALSDLETISKRIDSVGRLTKSGDKDAFAEVAALTPVKEALEKGEPARSVEIKKDDRVFLKQLNLLTAKPMIYIANVSEEDYKDPAKRTAAIERLGVDKDLATTVSAKVESELSELSDDDRIVFLKELGIKQSGLDDVIAAGYRALNLLTFFTSGEQETRAWTVRSGAKAPEAAGKIHSDFERGFIKADTVFWKDLVDSNGWAPARENAKVRMEGKEYVVKDGDVMLFKFNVS